MALLTPKNPKITGTAITYSAVNASDTLRYTNTPSCLLVKNGSGGPIDVTVVVPGTTFGQNNPDVVVTVADGAETAIGPFDKAMAVDGIITVQYSGTSSVTAALVQF